MGMVDNILILAGGAGTRLWPASLNDSPKQFIKVKNGKSLLELTIERGLKLGIKGKIIIITLESQLNEIVQECSPYSDTGKIAVLPEPAARNTAPAITAALTYLKLTGEAESTSLVLPADHMIENFEKFRENVENADILAKQGYLVTFGIPPQYPETGYGYIERGDYKRPGYTVASFREKPDYDTAVKFLSEGNYFWNSGMFAFSAETFLSELSIHSPGISCLFEKLESVPPLLNKQGIDIVMSSSDVEDIYKSSPRDSIDYAVMEKSHKCAMVRADFQWNDIGSWDQFETIMNNLGKAEKFEVDAENNIVFSDIPVALCDVSDLIVVIKNGKALICRKGSSQKVKDIRTVIETHNRKDLL